jgi:SAM-dependent methyltransferase
VSCPACGGPLSPWREVPAGEPRDSSHFPLLRCGRCGTAVTGGSPPASEAYSSGAYSPAPPRAAGLVRAIQRLVDRQPVGLLRRAGLAPGARVLDAGAGRGRLVGALLEAGFVATGIDPSERGGRVERRAIEKHTDAELDAVVMWHVLEHLDDPASGLERVRGWLRPGGLLLVATPNLASIQARIAGPGWLHLDVPRHRTHFTVTGLRALLERSGFRPLRSEHMVWEHNPASMWMGLLSRLGMTPSFPFHLLKRNVPARPRDLALLALGVPLAPVALALEAGAAAARRGGTIALLAKRLR